MQFSDQEISDFKTEAFELLDSAEASLLALDMGGDFQSKYDAIFRCFHSLKGAAGMMEMHELQSHMHVLESSFVTYKDKGAIPKEQTDYFLKGVDAAKTILNGGSVQLASMPEEKAPELVKTQMPDSALAEFVSECEDISQRVSLNFGLIEKFSNDPEIIDSIYRDIHSLKGSSQLYGFKQMGDLAHAMESSLGPIRDHKSPIAPGLMEVLFKCMDVVDRMVDRVRKKQPMEFEPVLAQLIPLLKRAEMGVVPAPTVAAPPPVSAQAAAPGAGSAPPAADPEAGSIRVSVSLLDRLMTLMSEMVLVRNQVLQYANRNDDLEFLNLSQKLNVVTGEIQGEMMKTRMQSIGNVVNKFHRVVRDLARDLGKKIELEVSGAETELDKTLLEAVKDPLTHIIRNSCDHGIEPTADRKAAGKSETGVVRLKAYHEGGQVIIEIQDDGRGLNREKLVAKAVEKGILTKEKGDALSEREAFSLIFAPGFSTAAAVTNVSGRGVGMDVVRNNIERIGGSIDLESQLGKGMTIRLKIPLTLAIVPAMIVRCQENRYAIPQLKLVELVRVEAGSGNGTIEYLQGKPIYRLRGNILPLIDLKEVLGTKAASDAARPDSVNIVVLNAEDRFFGLIVDEILDTADIVVKPLSRFLKSIATYSGATVLGDGSVALILDVVGIAQQQKLAPRKAVETQAEEMSQKSRALAHSQEFLLFKVASRTKHALFMGYVHRLEEFKRSSVEYSGGTRVIRYRGSILPLISLNERLGYQVEEENKPSEILSVVVVKRGDHFYGIEVDEILDVLTTEATVETGLADREGILGTLATDEEVVVVVDPTRVISGGRGVSETSAISVASDSGSGSGSGSALQAAPGQRCSLNILFAEDTAFFRKHVMKVLEDAGHKVTPVVNGEEALKLLDYSDAGTFDLVLSDIEMPKMNGFQLARAIRIRPKWGGLPLVALTTRSDKKAVDEGLKAGFNVYLEKMNPPDLLTALDQLGSKRKGAA